MIANAFEGLQKGNDFVGRRLKSRCCAKATMTLLVSSGYDRMYDAEGKISP